MSETNASKRATTAPVATEQAAGGPTAGGPMAGGPAAGEPGSAHRRRDGGARDSRAGDGRTRAGDGRTRTGGGRTRPRYGTHVVLLIGGLLMVFPFLWQINMSLSTHAEVTSVPPTWLPAEPQWGNYPAVFEQIPFLNQFLNTAAVTVLRVVGQLILWGVSPSVVAIPGWRGAAGRR